MSVTGEQADNAILLLEIKELLVRLIEAVEAMKAKMDQLETEFAPIARKAGRLTAAASALPGAGWRRNR